MPPQFFLNQKINENFQSNKNASIQPRQQNISRLYFVILFQNILYYNFFILYQRMFSSKNQMRLVQSTHNSVRSYINTQETKQKQQQKQDHIYEETIDINISLYKRFENFLLNQKFVKLKNALKKHYGRNHAIPYKNQFGFHQYWEDSKNKSELPDILQYFQFPHYYFYVLAFFVLVSKIGLMWHTSSHRLFRMDYNHPQLIGWALITILFDVILHYHLLKHYQFFKEASVLDYCKVFWKDIFLLLYYVFMPVHCPIFSRSMIIIDFTATFILYKRCQQIARCFKLEITSTAYKNTFNILQLFAKIVPISHIFSLCIYYMTEAHPQKNWMSVKDLNDLNPTQKYIYSLYFTCTTMLTVGYGDFTPVNITQMIVVMIIQVLGIITYGYIVNQIGHILGNVRKQQQVLSQDILTISKMAKYYDLDKALVSKAKNFLICKKSQSTNLTGQEQQKTLSKLNDDLREQIRQQNSLKVIKSSLFYVCNWTKRFQNQIAKKLHKRLFSPNQQIIQIPNKQRIYIFKKGKIQIHANRSSGYKKIFKKILRTIQAKQSMEVSDNIFGYSFLMSNTSIKLTAINKQFVAAYYVDKKDFLQTVMQSPLDVQYFFEMKSNIDMNPHPQSWEAPLIINTKQHYLPSIQFLIRKNKNLYNKQRNSRSTKFQQRRFRNRAKRIYYKSLQQMEGTMSNFIQSELCEYAFNIPQNLAPSNRSIDACREATWLTAMPIPNYEHQIFKKQSLHHMFEQGRQFSIYFKKANRSSVLQKLQNANFQLKVKGNEVKNFTKIKSDTQLMKKTDKCLEL